MSSEPEPLRRLREESAHWTRRLRRMEAVAMEGERVNWLVFIEYRAYVQGKADALEEVLAILAAARADEEPAVLLAQEGLDVDAIAGRCGLTVREVAEQLARNLAPDPKGGAE